MLVEHGLSRVALPDGTEYTFRPSLGRIAGLGYPDEIVAVFKGLFGRYAGREARHVLSVLCDQEDASELIGWLDESGWHSGLMPETEQVVLAVHLLRHGLLGTAKEEQPGSKSVKEFVVSEYLAAARVHLGMSAAEAEALSMTEFQELFEMKFPGKKSPEVPTREEYKAAMERRTNSFWHMHGDITR